MRLTFLDTAKGVPVMVTAWYNPGEREHLDCPEEPDEIEHYEVNPPSERTDEDEERWESRVYEMLADMRDEAFERRLEERDYWRGRA